MSNEEFISKLDSLPSENFMLKEIVKQESSLTTNAAIATGIEMSVVSRLLHCKRHSLARENLFKLIKRYAAGKDYVPTKNSQLIILFNYKKHFDLKWRDIAAVLDVSTSFLAAVLSERIELSADLQEKIKKHFKG